MAHRNDRVLIPLLQSYTQSGDFTVMKRFRSAVRYNIIYQLIVGSIALLGLVFLWYRQGPSNLRAYIMALSNSWGLVLVVIFMGYGMVDVPRRLWHKGDNARELRRISFKASVVKDKRQDTEDEVHNVAKVIIYRYCAIEEAMDQMQLNWHIRKALS